MCIAQWKASHTDGNLDDRKTLREALAYRNYTNSPVDVQNEAETVMMEADCDLLSDKGIYPEPNQCCRGMSVPFEGAVVYFVINTKRLLPKPAPYAKYAPEVLLDSVLKIEGHILFVSNWVDDGGNSVLPEPDRVNCGELAKALGMCGKKWKKNTPVTILALKIRQAHKSTWLDSGLAFFWYAATHCAEWGLTRSLETGRPCLREWVLPKKADAFEISDYWNRKVEQDYDLSADKLGSDYWDACAKEIRP